MVLQRGEAGGGGGINRSTRAVVLGTVALQDSRPGASQPKRRRGDRGRAEEAKTLQNHIKGGGRAPFLLLQRSSGESTSNGSAVPGGERFVFNLLM